MADDQRRRVGVGFGDRADGQFDGEPAADVGDGFDGQVAAHQPRQPAADRQPQPGAAEVPGDGAVGLGERLEQRVELRRFDADAGVGDGDPHAVAVAAAIERDLDRHAAGAGEFDGVADQVDQDLFESPRVGADLIGDPIAVIDVQRQLRLAGADVHDRLHVLDQSLGGEQLRFDVEFAGLDLREVQDVVDDLEEEFAVTPDRFEVSQPGPTVDVIEQQIGVAEDGGHRRANLVAHVGHERAFGVVGRLGGGGGGPQPVGGGLRVGDVVVQPDQPPPRPAVPLVLDDDAAAGQPAADPVIADDAEPRVVGVAVAKNVLDVFVQVGPIVGVNGVEKHRRRGGRLGVDAQQFVHRRIPVGQIVVRVPIERGHAAGVHRDREPGVEFVDALLDPGFLPVHHAGGFGRTGRFQPRRYDRGQRPHQLAFVFFPDVRTGPGDAQPVMRLVRGGVHRVDVGCDPERPPPIGFGSVDGDSHHVGDRDRASDVRSGSPGGDVRFEPPIHRQRRRAGGPRIVDQLGLRSRFVHPDQPAAVGLEVVADRVAGRREDLFGRHAIEQPQLQVGQECLVPFALFERRDISDGTDHRHRAAVVVPHDGRVAADPNPPAVAASHPTHQTEFVVVVAQR